MLYKKANDFSMVIVYIEAYDTILCGCMKKNQALALCLCLIMCYSFVTFSSGASISTQATISSYGSVSLMFTFGNSAIDTHVDQNDANAQSISYFTSTTTGSITDIMAYTAGVSSGNAIAALYAVNPGSADALLAQSKSVSIGTTFSWVDFQLPSAYTVTAGTTYRLAIMGNVPLNIMESGPGQRDHNAVSSYTNGFKNPFGSIWGTDYTEAMSIYASGTSSSTPTPTPVPTPTATPMPTATPTPTKTPTSSSVNLEPLSAFYSEVQSGGGASSYASLDNTVLHNGNPSVKVGPDYVRGTREVDGAWISVHPGDHIVMSVLVKTEAYTSTDIQAGASFGWDFYGSTSIGYAIAALNSNQEQAGHPNSAELNPFGADGGVNGFGYTINGEGGLCQVGGLICRVPWGQDWTHPMGFYCSNTSLLLCYR